MATATDIITYIGIPLAVLGVLPILYTFALGIITQRRIRSLLVAHGHRPHGTDCGQEGFLLRAGPMTSLIEVEMPRYTIAPVDRSEDRYWDVTREAGGPVVDGLGSSARLLAHGHGHGHGHVEGHAPERVESTLSMVEEGRVRGFLRGGSWRTFHWKRLVVGRKLYRIQYEDELKEPPAEIEFARLVDFLMDWGAELDGMGWEKLRTGGLWTPAGTVLLKICDDVTGDSDVESKISSTAAKHGDWVLRTSMPDDSDGILTLCVRWPPGQRYGSARNSSALPPGWGRLRRPDTTIDSDQELDQVSSSSSPPESLISTIRSLTSTSTCHPFHKSTSLRFKLDTNNTITTLHPEIQNTTTQTDPPISLTNLPSTTLTWFTTITSSLLTLQNTKTTGSLWGFTPPNQITTFIQKESIPSGVLVLLDLLPPHAAPHWDTTESDTTTQAQASATSHHRRFQARLQAERLEATMTPDAARVHRLNREADDRRAQMDDANQVLRDRRDRDARRVRDAIAGPRVAGHVVADVCLTWLKESSVVPREWALTRVVEAVLWMLVLQVVHERKKERRADEDDGDGNDGFSAVLRVLEQWMAWSTAGGMKVEQVEMLDRNKRDFCFAACLVAVVREADLLARDKGQASVDMLECLRLWRNVRLG